MIQACNGLAFNVFLFIVTVNASTSVSAIHLCGETYEVVFATYASFDFVTGSRRSQNVSTATAEEKVSC